MMFRNSDFSSFFIVGILAQVIFATECVLMENPPENVPKHNLTLPQGQNIVKPVEIPIKLNLSHDSHPPVDKEKSHINTEKATQLQKLIQKLYLAQAQVQLEANEIAKAQAVAGHGQKDLEEATNNVRIITSGLHLAQQAVAQAALRAQTAQLQLAAHDQLLFTARQKVDALSAQMVGLQAEVGIEIENHLPVNLKELLQKLHEPLSEKEKPTPIPTLIVEPKDDQKPPFIKRESIGYPFFDEYEDDYFSNDADDRQEE